MAVLRIPRKIKEFEYEGGEYGLRRPTVKEQETITRLMADYQRSIKIETKQDVEANIVDHSQQTGDLTLMTAVQVYIATWLVVDLESNKPYFSAAGNPEGDDIGTVPFDFIVAAWYCYSGQNVRDYTVAEINDLFGEDFVKANARIPSAVVLSELARLESAGETKKVHQIRVALELKAPGKESPDEDPQKTTASTTTFVSVEPSSESPSSSTSTPNPSEDGIGPTS